jgi:hypothetical protein
VTAGLRGLKDILDVEEWEGGILVANTNGNSVLVVQVVTELLLLVEQVEQV